MIKILQFSFLIMARKDANFSIARIVISGQLGGNKLHMLEVSLSKSITNFTTADDYTWERLRNHFRVTL